MERGDRMVGEDSITMEEIIENIIHQEGKTLVGEALEKSLDSVGSLPSDNSKALVMMEIADLLLDSDLLYLAERFGEDAVKSAQGIEITAEKAETFSRIASIFAEHDIAQMSDKIFKKALDRAEQVENEGKRIEVILHIIEDQLDKELKEKAEKNIDKALFKDLDLAENKDEVVPLAIAAETMAKIDKKKAEQLCEKVLSFTQKLDLRDDRDWALSSLAKAFSRLGRYDRSMELVEELRSGKSSDIQLVEVAITFSEKGQIKNALELRNYIKNSDLRDTLTGKIAADLILNNSIEKALKLREDIEDGFETDLLLKRIVSHYAVSDLKKARSYLQEIKSKEMKALAYSELALSNLHKDDQQRAKELSLKARDFVVGSKSDAVKVEIIASLIDIGLKKESAELAREITTPEERAIAFASIAAISY